MNERHKQFAADPASTGTDSPIDAQRSFWNSWNGIFLDGQRNQISQRQAVIVEQWLATLGRTDLSIMEVGCGTGWMSERLARFGTVTATDLADEILAAARVRLPHVTFLAGDIFEQTFAPGGAEVVVTLEVLSHVRDQEAFLERLADLLHPHGYLMLATQNRFVLERSEDVAPRAEGQIRNWVNRNELRRLLSKRFWIQELISICPHGHQGILRPVNSPRLNGWISTLIPQSRLDLCKERLWLGHTLMARAQRR
jgi:2-polyprenyl-3-methyl-5-hydroxy-6-metoxy-1,4-benzoquinol methylase